MSLIFKRRFSLRGLEVSGHKKKLACEKETRVSPSLAPVLSFAHYFQAPAVQARDDYVTVVVVVA